MKELVGMLLTDDEVVSAAVQGGTAWPFPLPTVELDRDSMLEAGSRGARSLLVRGLARTDNSALIVDDVASSLIQRITSSTDRVFAYVADYTNPAALAGSSTYLYQVPEVDDLAVLDLVSSSGVHDVRELTRAEGIELFLAAIENVFRLGVKGNSVDREPALFASNSSGLQAIAVQRQRVMFGAFGTSEGETIFAEESSTDLWDSRLVADALGMSPTLSKSETTLEGGRG